MKIFLLTEKNSMFQAAQRMPRGHRMPELADVIVGGGNICSGPLRLPADLIPAPLYRPDEPVDEQHNRRVAWWRQLLAKGRGDYIPALEQAARDAGADRIVVMVDPYTRPLAADIAEACGMPVAIATPEDIASIAPAILAAASAAC